MLTLHAADSELHHLAQVTSARCQHRKGGLCLSLSTQSVGYAPQPFTSPQHPVMTLPELIAVMVAKW